MVKFKLPLFTLLFLSLLGAGFIGIVIHEGVHLIQAKEVYSVCYDINQKSFMHVEGDFKDNVNYEFPAYLISSTIILILFICLYVDFSNRRFKDENK